MSIALEVQMQDRKIQKHLFPAIAMLLGLSVGVFVFANRPTTSQKYSQEQFFRPVTLGLTTTYLILAVGTSLRRTKDRLAKRKKLGT